MVIFSQCIDCKNFIGRKEDGTYTCKAFPDGIDPDILWNKKDHKEEINGDNGIRYEEI